MIRKTIGILLCALTAAMTACSDDSAVYYSTSYPIVRIEATVKMAAVEGSAEENPLVAPITAAVIADAPVQATGRYVLDFSEYNGGVLSVYSTADAAPVAGTFVKVPGQTDLQMIFGQNDYTCTQGRYSEDGKAMIVFSIDLTAAYQALYPDDGIESVVRREYTSIPY